MNLETEGKIYLLITFIQRFVTQSKLSLIFTKTAYYFSDSSHDALKNADNSKFHITKLNPWKLIFRKQPIIAGDEIKVNVILTTKYKVKAKNFIIPIFDFSVSFLLYLRPFSHHVTMFFLLFHFLFPFLSSLKTFSRHLKNK